jgi:tRNA(adenine34) deaminase
VNQSHVTEPSAADLAFMQLALAEAAAAGQRAEVPIGAVIAVGDAVLARAGNATISQCDPTAHAEIVALRAGAKSISNHRFARATLYVTIEPCAMCAGAILQARISRVVYGADDPKGGAARSCFAMFDHPALNHSVDWTPGILAAESAALLQGFFAARR